jgi:hypothetical protein
MKVKRPRAEIRKVAIASAASPVNLGVLGAGILGTLGLVAAGHATLGVLVLGLGAAAYGALIGLDLFSDKFISKVYDLPDPDAEAGADSAPVPQVSPNEIHPEEIRGLYKAVLDNHAEVRETVQVGGEMLRESLRETLDRCGELVREAGRVAQRGNALHAYLRREDPRTIAAEADRLERQARDTRDDKAALSFQKAAAAKRQQHATYEQIEGLYDRIKAQLAVIETSLDGVQAKVIKLNATDIEEAATVGASISQHLDALSTDMQVLESTVSETLEEFDL